MHRIAEIRRLDHVVLLVAAQAVLRTERRGDVQAANRTQCVQRVLEVRGHRSRVRQQGHAPSFELAQQLAVRQQPVDAELDHAASLIAARQSSSIAKPSA
jgi:hypothetical protein